MKKVTILGATGSIGLSTLNILEQHPSQFEIFALSAHQRFEALLELCQRYKPKYAVLTAENHLAALQALFKKHGLATQLLVGPDALCDIAADTEVDIVMAAIVGSAGLPSTLAALKAGKRVLLANKEALIMAGDLVLETRRQHNASLLPVDSEHNAIFQCLPSDYLANHLFPAAAASPIDFGISKIILTASGGAFRDLPIEELSHATPEQACQHPNWVMGKKVTIDSATMMNKALEVIEAHYLFAMQPQQIEVLLHPQSIIHSLVSYQDGSMLAQLGVPDMRTPIANALSWPDRITNSVPQLDLVEVAKLEFKAMDLHRYPALKLAYGALELGGVAATYLNAANEVAVDAFIETKIKFTDIAIINEQVLNTCSAHQANTLEAILQADQEARRYAQALVKSITA